MPVFFSDDDDDDDDVVAVGTHGAATSTSFRDALESILEAFTPSSDR
jgi:hypothetical protein